MTVKRYDQFGDEALADSWPVYVLASDYDDLLAERALIVTRAENAEAALVESEARLAEADALLREASSAIDDRLSYMSGDPLAELAARIDAHLGRDA